VPTGDREKDLEASSTYDCRLDLKRKRFWEGEEKELRYPEDSGSDDLVSGWRGEKQSTPNSSLLRRRLRMDWPSLVVSPAPVTPPIEQQ